MDLFLNLTMLLPNLLSYILLCRSLATTYQCSISLSSNLAKEPLHGTEKCLRSGSRIDRTRMRRVGMYKVAMVICLTNKIRTVLQHAHENKARSDRSRTKRQIHKH